MIKLSLNLPRSCERIRGFTEPENGVLFVFDYDEVFRIDLKCNSSPQQLHQSAYEFECNNPNYYGASGKHPLIKVGATKLSYLFNPQSDLQSVAITLAEKTTSLSFATLSGDWFVATLSPCQNYLIMAEPYLIEAYSLV